MNDYIRLKLIGDFEFLSVVLPLADDEKRLFDDMARIYRVAERDAEILYALCSHPSVREIRTRLDFGSYHWASDSLNAPATDVDDVIRARGEAIVYATRKKLVKSTAVTPAERYRNLGETASEGNVRALYALGVAKSGGYGTDADRKLAMTCLRKAARWNFAAAAVFLMSYDEKNAGEYASALYGSADASCKGQIGGFISECGLKPAEDRRAEMLGAMFSAKDLEPDVINPSVAKILYSEILSETSKTCALFSQRKEVLAAVAGIPDRLPRAELCDVKVSAPLSRDGDGKKLERMLRGFGNASDENYRPVMICSDEAYVRDAYAASLKGVLGNCNVLNVDAGKTGDEFFEMTQKNIVISNLTSKKPNVVLFKVQGNVSPVKMGFIKRFLDTSMRSNLNFFMFVGVTVNLANVVPVVLSDRKCAEELRECCVTISPENTTKDERTHVISRSCADTSLLYGMECMELEEDALRYLSGCDLDAVLSRLARMVCATEDGDKISVDTAMREMRGTVSVPLGFMESDRR
ncbi:MAG: hypothetical protein LUD47_05285 [Clostridia bacterium]|nr:hypothetical protein [Clostridia bacterium]